MKWIVGTDLRPDSDGVAQFAAWMARTGEGDTAVFVHVLEEEHLRYALMQHHLDEVIAAARKEAERLLSRTGAAGELRVVQGLTAEDALEAARAEAGAGALAVGRAAGREGHHVVRLGRVARRLLRRLSAPVAIVPPDLRAEELGGGPIVVLSNLSDDSAPACRFAAELAGRLRRPLAAVHVARRVETPYLPGQGLERALGDRKADAERALRDWLAANGLRAGSAVVVVGSPIEGALEWASDQASPFVVVGSRQLSGTDRIFHTSTGTSLAATARIPVIVVPSKP